MSTFITATATTIIAIVGIIGLTAASQEYVLNKERDVAIQLNNLSGKASRLEENQAEFSLKILALEKGQDEIRINMVTRDDLDAALDATLNAILLALKEKETEK